MGHSKLQIHLGRTLDMKHLYECFLADEEGKIFCIVTGKDSEHKEITERANLIITAVNVMPKVIGLLRGVDEEKIHLRTLGFETLCRNLLKELEAVDVC